MKTLIILGTNVVADLTLCSDFQTTGKFSHFGLRWYDDGSVFAHEGYPWMIY